MNAVEAYFLGVFMFGISIALFNAIGKRNQKLSTNDFGAEAVVTSLIRKVEDPNGLDPHPDVDRGRMFLYWLNLHGYKVVRK